MIQWFLRFVRGHKLWFGIGIGAMGLGGVAIGAVAYMRPHAVIGIQDAVASVLNIIPKTVPDVSPSVSPDPFDQIRADVTAIKEGLAAVQEGYSHDAGQRQDLVERFGTTSNKLDEQQKLLQSKAATLDLAIANINKQINAFDGQITVPPLSTVVPSASPAASKKININTATITELDVLPGVGPATAQNIIAYRTEHGPFASVDDLANVTRISPAMVDEMRRQIEV